MLAMVVELILELLLIVVELTIAAVLGLARRPRHRVARIVRVAGLVCVAGAIVLVAGAISGSLHALEYLYASPMLLGVALLAGTIIEVYAERARGHASRRARLRAAWKRRVASVRSGGVGPGCEPEQRGLGRYAEAHRKDGGADAG